MKLGRFSDESKLFQTYALIFSRAYIWKVPIINNNHYCCPSNKFRDNYKYGYRIAIITSAIPVTEIAIMGKNENATNELINNFTFF